VKIIKDKDLKDVIGLYVSSGLTLIRDKNHQVWRCPCGHTQVVLRCSPSGGRGDKNAKAQLKRTLRECAERKQEEKAA